MSDSSKPPESPPELHFSSAPSGLYEVGPGRWKYCANGIEYPLSRIDENERLRGAWEGYIGTPDRGCDFACHSTSLECDETIDRRIEAWCMVCWLRAAMKGGGQVNAIDHREVVTAEIYRKADADYDGRKTAYIEAAADLILELRAEIAALKEEVAENKKLRVAFDNVWAHREKHPPQHVFEQGQRFLLISLRTAMEAK